MKKENKLARDRRRLAHTLAKIIRGEETLDGGSAVLRSVLKKASYNKYVGGESWAPFDEDTLKFKEEE